MIIAITGSVGCGKTIITEQILKLRKSEVIYLNDFAKKYYLREDIENQTNEINLEKLVLDIEKIILKYKKVKKNCIIEGHFSHFISDTLVDFLVILNRPLNELKKEYIKRGYSEKKSKENLEVESFDTCFFEALEEGYSEKRIIRISNTNKISLNNLVDEILNKTKIGEKK